MGDAWGLSMGDLGEFIILGTQIFMIYMIANGKSYKS